MKCFYTVAGTITLLAICAVAVSQEAASSSDGTNPVTVAVFKGMPYSATRIRTVTKSGPNGQTTTETYKSLLWRDAEGRTRQEDIQEVAGFGEMRIINLDDPVAHVHYAWSDGKRLDKQVNGVMVMHTPVPWREKVIFPDSSSAAKPQTALVPGPRPTNDPNRKAEVLEPKELNGIRVEGLRSIQVIPASQQTNSHEVTVTSEKWISFELKLTIYSMEDDPRTGRTVIELTNVNRSEPAPELFRPPTDRPMRDANPTAQGAFTQAH